MQMYAPPPPPPRRRGFPFLLTGCLLAFATVCAVTVAGALAFAFLAVRVSDSPHVASQTGDLFLLHMAAGRYAEASRLVSPEFAGGIAAIGQGSKETWGESQGCRRVHTNVDVNFDNGRLRDEQRAFLEYSVKGSDGKVRAVAMKVVNGLIAGITVDGQAVLGDVPEPGRHHGGGCRVEAPPVPVKPGPAEKVEEHDRQD
jgi:hypothetical protein